jgi:glycine betaine/proline transport system substrate-binding protein
MTILTRTACSLLALGLSAGSALAGGHGDCGKVTFSDVGWTDITATTAATSVVLEALGYETEALVLSVPVTYTSLASGDIDVFLGNWMPTMEADIAPYRSPPTPMARRWGLGISPISPVQPMRWTARSTASSPAMTATA